MPLRLKVEYHSNPSTRASTIVGMLSGVLVLVVYNDFFILRRAVSYPTHTSTYTHIHIFFLLDRGSSKRQLLFKPGTSTALCVRGNCTLSGKYNYYIIPLDGNELLEIHTKSLFVNKFSYMFLMLEILKYGIKLWRLNG